MIVFVILQWFKSKSASLTCDSLVAAKLPSYFSAFIDSFTWSSAVNLANLLGEVIFSFN